MRTKLGLDVDTSSASIHPLWIGAKIPAAPGAAFGIPLLLTGRLPDESHVRLKTTERGNQSASCFHGRSMY